LLLLLLLLPQLLRLLAWVLLAQASLLLLLLLLLYPAQRAMMLAQACPLLLLYHHAALRYPHPLQPLGCQLQLLQRKPAWLQHQYQRLLLRLLYLLHVQECWQAPAAAAAALQTP
jgi:hypothetical protein